MAAATPALTPAQSAGEQFGGAGGGGIGGSARAARYFAGREPDILALWDSSHQRETYDWFATELTNLRTAFRWAADEGELDSAISATYSAFLGVLVHNYGPTTWAEELIQPACAADDPRLVFLYVMASVCCMAGRIDEAVGYADAAQLAIASGRHDEVPFGGDAVLGTAYAFTAQPERWVAWSPYVDPAYESLARKGESMTTAAMVTYALDQIDQARAELKTGSDQVTYEKHWRTRAWPSRSANSAAPVVTFPCCCGRVPRPARNGLRSSRLVAAICRPQVRPRRLLRCNSEIRVARYLSRAGR